MTTLAPHALDDAEARDHVELQRLAYLYCHAVDHGDMVLLRSLYTDDAVDDHGEMFRGSADEYVAWLPTMLKGVDAIRHEVTNALFVVDGDSAKGQLTNTAYHRMGEVEVVVGGRYLDRYARQGGAWRIQRRSLVMDWFQQRAATPAGGFIGKGVTWAEIGPGDPGAQLLSG